MIRLDDQRGGRPEAETERTTCSPPSDGGVSSGSQSYSEYPPPPGLDAYVACLWVQQVSADGQGYAHLTVPNGSAELACDLDTAAIRVVGHQTKPRHGYLAPGRTVVGVRFRPGAGQSIIGLPASEIVAPSPAEGWC